MGHVADIDVTHNVYGQGTGGRASGCGHPVEKYRKSINRDRGANELRAHYPVRSDGPNRELRKLPHGATRPL